MYNKFMDLAISEAKKAEAEGEIPVGAVVVKDGRVLAKAHNRRENDKNALAHAETEAIRKACEVLGSWRLDGCDIYVTLEPCVMCAGAIINSRIRRCYFGAFDLRFGGCGSATNLFELELNHKVECYAGIMEEECKALLQGFFEKLR